MMHTVSTISAHAQRRQRRGVAMAVVITVMSLAAVLAWAMLAGTSIQSQVGGNNMNAAVADAQAESGVHLAMYYLLNPQYAPSLTNGHWAGANSITFASTTQPSSPIPGNCTVSVSTPAGYAANQYYVTSIGTSQGSSYGGGTIARTLGAQIQLTTAYVVKQAATFNCAVTMNSGMTITGSPDAIRSTQSVTLSGGTINGDVHALSVSSGFNGHQYAAPALPPAPTAADLHDYSQPYTYQGVTYSPVKLASATLSNKTLGPTAGNPLGIFWYSADVFLAGTVTINGTLAVKNGNLWLTGKNNFITPAAQMPAAVIDKQLEATLGNVGMTANGVVYAGTGLKGVGSSPGFVNLTINGGLLINTGGITNWLGTTSINYTANNANVPNLSSANQVPVGVQAIAWFP